MKNFVNSEATQFIVITLANATCLLQFDFISSKFGTFNSIITSSPSSDLYQAPCTYMQFLAFDSSIPIHASRALENIIYRFVFSHLWCVRFFYYSCVYCFVLNVREDGCVFKVHKVAHTCYIVRTSIFIHKD